MKMTNDLELPLLIVVKQTRPACQSTKLMCHTAHARDIAKLMGTVNHLVFTASKFDDFKILHFNRY